jgi:hypothetical protein
VLAPTSLSFPNVDAHPPFWARWIFIYVRGLDVVIIMYTYSGCTFETGERDYRCWSSWVLMRISVVLRFCWYVPHVNMNRFNLCLSASLSHTHIEGIQELEIMFHAQAQNSDDTRLFIGRNSSWLGKKCFFSREKPRTYLHDLHWKLKNCTQLPGPAAIFEVNTERNRFFAIRSSPVVFWFLCFSESQ